MEKRDRLIISVLGASCAIFALIAIFSLAGKSSVKKGEMRLQEEMRRVSLENVKLANTIRDLEGSKGDIQRKFSDSDRVIKELTAELKEEKNNGSRLTGEIANQKSEIKSLKSLTTKYQKENDALRRRLKSMDAAFDDLKLKFDKLLAAAEKESRSEIERLNRRIEELSREKGATSLGTVVIR